MMKVYLGLDELPTEPVQRVATIGTFDGIHKGHVFVLHQLIHLAQQKQSNSMLITLNPHPRLFFNPNAPLKLIHTLDEKLHTLKHLGLSECLVLPFNQEIANLTAEQFLREIVFSKLSVQTLLVGYDNRFGKNREGNVDLIRRVAGGMGCEVITLPALPTKQKLSSTIIRQYLLNGQIEQANDLLYEPFTLAGKVVDGDHRGRTLGFPTANVQITDPHKLIPRFGVYIANASLAERTYHAVVNIGERPTFNGLISQVEAYLLDFNQDIYGQTLTLQLLSFLRPEQRFPSVHALIAQIQQDIEATKAFFQQVTP